VPELHRLARTIDAWRNELLAYFDTGGISNGPTEAMNLLIKKIKRTGHGFRNFDNYRLRLLLALRSRLADSVTNTNQRPATTVVCVELFFLIYQRCNTGLYPVSTPDSR
jgi:hypothetical protein